MDSVTATIIVAVMIAKPSIAFNDFAGSAKDVTARSVKGRTVLSVKAYQNKIVTAAQAVSRNYLSKVSRAYKQLTDSQMKAWGDLAGHLKGISTFGMTGELTGHNAFVRINYNRKMAGMSILEEAPVYASDVPEVDYQNFWVAPSFICFTGIEKPKESYKLVVKMSAGLSAGVSSGWGKTVIVSPGADEDWGEVDVTKVYTEAIGYAPKLGDSVFIELYWMDTETGFVGETIRLKVTCKTEGQVEAEAYVPRMRMTADNLKTVDSGAIVTKCSLEQAEGSALMSGEVIGSIKGIVSAINGDLQDMPDGWLAGRCYLPARGTGKNAWSIDLMEIYTTWSKFWKDYKFSHRYGVYDPDFEMFGTSALVN